MAKSDLVDTTEVPDDETGDEVKVFRTNDIDDSVDNASSSAELTADKKDLALEADIESQTGQNDRLPQQSAFNYNYMPSPSFNFLHPLFVPLSPLAPLAYSNFATANYMANQLLMSPNYNRLAQNSNAISNAMQFLLSPRFSQQSNVLNSPLTAMANGVNGMSLLDRSQQTPTSNYLHQGLATSSNSTPMASSQRHTPTSTSSHHLKTPKREKVEKLIEKRDKNHIKKPCNAFMLFMKENRQKFLAEEGTQQKQSALINQKLGKIWQELPKSEQDIYYALAAKEREKHRELHPDWSARENYAINKKKKKKREKSMENNEQKKCRARFGVDHMEKWCKHCRRKKRCLNVREAESPMVSSTTTATTPLSLSQQQQQQPLNLMQNNRHISSPASSAGMMSEKRSESTSTTDHLSDAAQSPHSSHMKYNSGMSNGIISGKVSPADFEIPKPMPTHLAASTAIQHQQFMQQQMMFNSFPYGIQNSFLNSPFFDPSNLIKQETKYENV